MRGRGRRPTENWAVLICILWRLRCGAPWREVPRSTASGKRFIGGSGAGARPAPGRLCRSPWPKEWRTPATTASTVPPSAATSRQRG
ncbi:transposase [Sphingomonas sp. Leaf208]|uniref:transposase n=1 Tax=Sphingomonas sp. Leaf208 TaxID=1735679 RepID=UPI0039E01FA9